MDALIIGGGPAGVSAAITLRQRGFDARIVERHTFPRYHIGESLIPEGVRVLRALGLEDRVAAEGFVVKPGARFFDRAAGIDVNLTFADAPRDEDAPIAWQVERDRFDEIMLDGARDAGVDVRCPARVLDVLAPGSDGVDVKVEDADGEHTWRAKVVIDTSGHKSVCARRFGLRKRLAGLETHAFFGYFEGLTCAEGANGGNVVIGFTEGGWLWGIPLRNGITSVGLVLGAEVARGEKSDPKALLLDRAQACLPYPEDLSAALRSEVEAYGAINYAATTYALDRVVLAGDAAAFLDPVFSTGVYLGLWGAREAALAVADGLEAGDLSQAAFDGYQQKLRVVHHVSLELIQMFYQGRFSNLLRAMDGRPELVEEIVGLLSGDLVSGRGMMSRALVKRADPHAPLATV